VKDADEVVLDRDERPVELQRCRATVEVDRRLGRDAVALLGDCGKELGDAAAVVVLSRTICTAASCRQVSFPGAAPSSA
jgi:hypothetical protein